MQVNQSTVDLVKRWEGFKAEAYLCPANVWTIGYGTTSRAGIGVTVTRGMRTTQAEAERWLRMGLERFADQIRPAITAPINENQFGAFVSLAYHIGPGAFRGSSALRHFNAGDTARAAAAIKLWNKATINGKRQVQRGIACRRCRRHRTPQRRPVVCPRKPDSHAIKREAVFAKHCSCNSWHVRLLIRSAPRGC